MATATGCGVSRLLCPEFYDDERLATSSLIVADDMSAVSTKEIGTGMFVIGNYEGTAAGGSGRRQAGSFQERKPEGVFLDAGLQSGRG